MVSLRVLCLSTFRILTSPSDSLISLKRQTQADRDKDIKNLSSLIRKYDQD